MTIPKLPGESEDEFDVRWDQVFDDFHARLKAAGVGNTPVRLWPAAFRAEAEQAWECIFDRTNFSRRDYWQATLHELHAGEVVEAVRIVG